MFNEHKIAQMAAYFLARHDGRMSYLKLMKLLYLAERRSLEVYGLPMSGDKPSALPHGPVLTMTLDLMSGNIHKDGWDTWISGKEDYEVALKRNVERNALDELSDADLEILESVWKDFGRLSKWEIRDYTHAHCPEWTDPHGSSRPIAYYEILRAVGKSEEEARAISEYIESMDGLDKLFRTL
jgi:uncharacterized phage-associated protein